MVQHSFSLIHFILTYDSNERNVLNICITHLFLHFRSVGEYLGTNTGCAGLRQNTHRKSSFFLTEVNKQKLSAINGLLRIQFQLVEHIENTVGTKRNTYARYPCHTEYTSQVIVTTSTGDTANLHIKRLHLKNSTCIVIQSTCQCQVKLYFVFQSHRLKGIQNKLTLFHSLQTCFAIGKYSLQCSQLLSIGSTQKNDRLQFGNSLFTDTLLGQLFIDIVQTNFIQFIDCYCNIYYFIRLSYDFGNTGQNLTIIDFNANADTETGKHRINNLHQFNFVQQ